MEDAPQIQFFTQAINLHASHVYYSNRSAAYARCVLVHTLGATHRALSPARM